MFYAFLVGTGVTATGFGIAWLDRQVDRGTSLVVTGSETMRPWFEACAKAFERAQPGTRVVVRGGGTAPGVAALLAGQTDLALASRPLTEAETRAGAEEANGLVAWPVGQGAIAVIVHPAVGVEQLDLKSLAGVFNGSVTNWAQLGAPPLPIVAVARDGDSGTAWVMQNKVLAGRALAPGGKALARHEDVIGTVAATPGAIGYVDAQAAKVHDTKVRVVALRVDAGGTPRRPTDQDLAAYPLVRELTLVGRERMEGGASALAAFCRGASGQALLAPAGFKLAANATKD